MIRFPSILRPRLSRCYLFPSRTVAMSGGQVRICVMLFTAAILYIGLYNYQEEIVEMVTIIKPGKRNIQINVF